MPDWSAIDLPDFERKIRDRTGLSSAIYLPMLREGQCIGVLGLASTQAHNFASSDIALAESFRDQALIAIENARSFNETRKALERQTATADILKVIASSPSDVQPVFEAVAQAAVRLLHCDTAHFMRCDAQAFVSVAVAGRQGLLPIRVSDPVPIDADANFPSRAIIARKVQHLPDWSMLDLPPYQKQIQDVHGMHSSLYLPMLRGEQCIYLLAIASRRANHFDASDIALAELFRDQAQIAVENARQFNETKEALERQTATADILKVIASSPSDTQPVFQAIADRAKRLLGSYTAVVTRVIDDVVHLAAGTADNEVAAHAVQGLLPYPLSSPRIHARVARTGQIAVNEDADSSDLPDKVKEFARTIGWRSMLVVPMLRNGVAIGTIGITRREAGKFDDKTVDLLKTFADQAVIAIENARLFNETQEALEHQTATAEVLQVISGSMADPKPVFERIADSIERLFECKQIGIFLTPGDGLLHLAAGRGANMEFVTSVYPLPVEQTAAPFVLGARQEVYYEDCLNGANVPPSLRRAAETIGNFSDLLTPMMWEGRGVGMMTITREPYTPVQRQGTRRCCGRSPTRP